jgi:hypothetical protein
LEQDPDPFFEVRSLEAFFYEIDPFGNPQEVLIEMGIMVPIRENGIGDGNAFRIKFEQPRETAESAAEVEDGFSSEMASPQFRISLVDERKEFIGRNAGGDVQFFSYGFLAWVEEGRYFALVFWDIESDSERESGRGESGLQVLRSGIHLCVIHGGRGVGEMGGMGFSILVSKQKYVASFPRTYEVSGKAALTQWSRLHKYEATMSDGPYV